MSADRFTLSTRQAETLLRATALAPGEGNWRLEAIASNRRDPGVRQQFIVKVDRPCGFLTIGPDLTEHIRRTRRFASSFPDLAAEILGQERHEDRDLFLQAFVPGRPLLEAYPNDPARIVSALTELEQRFARQLTASSPEAAHAELGHIGEELLALSLWTEAGQEYLRDCVLPFLHERLVTAAPLKRVSNCDFMSRNVLVTTDGQLRIIDHENTAVTHFHGEDWLRFGFWDQLDPVVRSFVNARVGDRTAWTVFLAMRQLILETRHHRARPSKIDAQRWCREISSALATDPNFSSKPFFRPPPTLVPAPKIGAQLFWETNTGWNEASSQLIEVAPGPHTLTFSVPAGVGIRQLRFDPLDLPGTALIGRIVIRSHPSLENFFEATGSELRCLIPAGDAVVETLADGSGLRIVSQGNDPQLYFPKLTLNAQTQLQVEVTLTVALPDGDQPAFPEKNPPGPFHSLLGNVEHITTEAVLGWAHDPTQPAQAVEVDIFFDDRRVATVLASAFREDLRAARLGDGRKAFFFNPSPHFPGTGVAVSVRVAHARTGETLPNGIGHLETATKREEPDWDAPFRDQLPPPPVVDRLAGFQREQWPLISIIMPVFNPPPAFLEDAVQSVLGQSYPKWELWVVDDASTDEAVLSYLRKLSALDHRIKIRLETANRGISAATNLGIAAASGAYVALLDHDDELTPDTLAEVACAFLADPATDVVYSDQDKRGEDGSQFQPFHKPAWSPVYLLGVMYVGHLLVVRTELLRRVGGCDSHFDRVQDYELMLRLAETGPRIAHIPKILYHWRISAGSIAYSSHAKGPVDALQVAAVQAHLNRRNIPLLAVSHLRLPHRVQLVPAGSQSPRFVSIIIPSKDAAAHLGRCLESIFRLTTHPRFEVIVVDNGTTDPAALAVLAAYPIRRLDHTGTFNFSRANNLAAREAQGEVLLFLNNDTEVVTPDWLQILLGHLALPGVGAVGPMLLYPDGKVQHAGVALGLRGTCDHLLRWADPAADGYAGSLPCAREVSCLTAACLMVTRDLFNTLGGMEAGYASIYQDADFCLRVRERGLSNIYVGNVALRHHEGASRGQDYNFVDRAIFLDRWGPAVAAGDPYFNCNFTRNRCDYTPR